MAKIRFKRYLHSSKESNYDICKFFDTDELKYLGYEEELIYEYDTETKEYELIGANGRFLGDEEITSCELTNISDEVNYEGIPF